MSSAETKKRSLTILWRIENFSFCMHGFPASEIRTLPLRSRIFYERLCYLRMCPNGDNVGDTCVRLHFIQQGEALGYMINCEWSFLDADGSPLASWTVKNHATKSYTPYLPPGCPTKEELFETRKSSFLPDDTLTVRLRVWKFHGEFAQAEHFSILTRMRVSEHSLLWPIEGFSTLKLDQNVTELVYVPCFPAGENAFELNFALKGPRLPNSRVDCKIKSNQNCRPALMKVKVSVLDSGQQAITCGEKTFELSSSNSVVCNMNFVSRKHLLAKKSECLRGDVLTLLCVLTYFTGENSSIIERTYFGPSNLERKLPRNDVALVSKASCRSLVTLGDDFLSLYRDRCLSDFELRSSNDVFPVHKLVLSVRSPFFKNLFSSRNKSDLKFLQIEDVDDHTLERMLTFLYAGAVDDLQWEDAAKLYDAAHKYQVTSLQKQCSSVIRSSIGVSNMCEILALANKHRDHGLTTLVHDFILDHYDDVLVSDEWVTFLETESYLTGITVHAVTKERITARKEL